MKNTPDSESTGYDRPRPRARTRPQMSSNIQPTTDRATRQRDRPRAGARLTVSHEDPWTAEGETAETDNATALAPLLFDPFCGRPLPNTIGRTNRAMPDGG